MSIIKAPVPEVGRFSSFMIRPPRVEILTRFCPGETALPVTLTGLVISWLGRGLSMDAVPGDAFPCGVVFIPGEGRLTWGEETSGQFILKPTPSGGWANWTLTTVIASSGPVLGCDLFLYR